jgi:hypothetical protein
MGQFNSRVFDGDPYIDLVRAIPEREITFWVQRVIWIAQGYTALEHAARAWPPLMLHKCSTCDGHGLMTCPHCRGGKLRSSAARMSFLGPDPALMPVGGGGVALAVGAGGGRGSSSRAPTTASPSSSSSSSSTLLSGGGAAALAAALATPSPSSTAAHDHNDSDDSPCRHCGEFLPWDNEVAWPERWRAWERVASYYDQSLAPLMDEWHDDVVNKKQRPVDSPGHDYFAGDAPGPIPEGSPWDDGPGGRAAAERWGKRAGERLAATMARFGGHPYETGDVFPFDALDPFEESTQGNLWRLRAALADPGGPDGVGPQGGLLFPPELDGNVAPELARARPGDVPPWMRAGGGGGGEGDAGGASSSSAAFLATPAELKSEIRAQAKLAANLEAAARGGAKPHAFAASAGTVPCPDCAGRPWAWSWVPNVRTLLGSEPPPMLKAVWARTEDRARVAGQLRAAGMMAGGAGGDGEASSSSPASLGELLPRPLLEYPALAAPEDGLPLDPAGRQAALGVIGGVSAEAARNKAARRAAAAAAAASAAGAEGSWAGDERGLPFWQRERAIAGTDAQGDAARAERALSREPHPVFGGSDPLSDDFAKVVGSGGGGGGRGGAGGAGSAPAPPPPDGWDARAAMPGRQAARALRDARLRQALEREGDVQGVAELDAYLARRGRTAAGGGGGGGGGGRAAA